ncbi:MAG: hypothetical protein AAB879_03815, partial [Patescibacteria group bacterium]
MRHFAIFGSHPRLSLAEFRAIRPEIPSPLLLASAAIFETEKWDGGDLMQCLGGTVKLGDIVATIPTAELTGERLITPPPAPPLKLRGWVRGGALDFGLTIFGSKKFSKLPIEFKRALKSLGISSRWVTGKGGTEIAPAAVAKLKLMSEGIDLCLFVVGDVTHIGKTTHVQDADAWSTRDYGRPRRDILAGMLPPKLARMMVNLATPILQLNKEGGRGVVLDPFCGSGTILMEAALATDAARIIGSDSDDEHISDTRKNIAWLVQNHILTSRDEQRIETCVCDARRLSTKFAPRSMTAVVTEGTLGPPLRGHESHAALERNAREVTELWIATLKELRPLL